MNSDGLFLACVLAGMTALCVIFGVGVAVVVGVIFALSVQFGLSSRN